MNPMVWFSLSKQAKRATARKEAAAALPTNCLCEGESGLKSLAAACHAVQAVGAQPVPVTVQNGKLCLGANHHELAPLCGREACRRQALPAALAAKACIPADAAASLTAAVMAGIPVLLYPDGVHWDEQCRGGMHDALKALACTHAVMICGEMPAGTGNEPGEALDPDVTVLVLTRRDKETRASHDLSAKDLPFLPDLITDDPALVCDVVICKRELSLPGGILVLCGEPGLPMPIAERAKLAALIAGRIAKEER